MEDSMSISEALDELEEFDDWDDFNDPDESPVTKEEEMFANEMFDLVQSFICTDDVITEEYISKNCLNKHYHKHCLDNQPNRKSSRSCVFYDFTNRDKYRVYCDRIVEDILNTENRVFSLLDSKSVYKLIRKLFEGNVSIQFTYSCGFKNDSGGVIIGVHSYATSKTKNYQNNTLDLAIISHNKKIISMYPIDASYFETKFNHLIQRYTDLGVDFKINH